MAGRMTCPFSSSFNCLGTWIATRAHYLEQLSCRKRNGFAFLFGLLSALAFPPINCSFLLWICFPVLLFLLRGTANAKQAFVTGWCFAFGFLLLGLYWIANAMFVDIAQFWWAVPLALAGLPIFFALDYGIAAAVARRFGLQGPTGVVFFGLCWFLADYARGHLFTGFPWILVGYTWSGVLPMLQFTSIAGIYGLSFVTILAALAPALLTDNTRLSRRLFVGSLGVMLVLAGWGTLRLAQDHGDVTPNARLRLVQPNIDQAHKWEASEKEGHFQDLLNLTSAPPQDAAKPVTHIVWPETAATFYLVEDAPHRFDIAAHLPEKGSLITGVIRRTVGDDDKFHYYNSLIAVNTKAQVLAGYDKFHLVPFGEYIPFRKFLPLRTLANMGLDFSTGEGLRSLRVAGLPSFSPLICYEAIFPGAVADHDDRPHFLLNITNDGWYGKTAGPYQHFAIVRVRAIEEGVPLARAANTGISGMVDAYGRVTSQLDVGMTGFVDADIPAPLPPTIFSLYGETFLWSLFGVALFFAVIRHCRAMKVFRRS